MKQQLQQIDDENIDLADIEKTRKAMYQQRRKQLPKLPKSRAETHERVADYDMTSSRGEPMVQVNDAANGIIIYTTTTNLQLLCDRQSTIFGDDLKPVLDGR
ncbi:hypothetical protein ACOMHN_022502 [Nucella lapillus]